MSPLTRLNSSDSPIWPPGPLSRLYGFHRLHTVLVLFVRCEGRLVRPFRCPAPPADCHARYRACSTVVHCRALSFCDGVVLMDRDLVDEVVLMDLVHHRCLLRCVVVFFSSLRRSHSRPQGPLHSYRLHFSYDEPWPRPGPPSVRFFQAQARSSQDFQANPGLQNH